MDRINGANTVDIGGGKRGFRDRNLSAGLSGTQVNAGFMNPLQEELLGVIEAAGLTPDAGDWAQLRAALQALFGGGGTLANPGWQRLPGGLIVQWGQAMSVPAGGTVTVTYPVAFPFMALSGSATPGSSGAVGLGANVNLFGPGADQTKCTISNSGDTPCSIAWIVLGV